MLQSEVSARGESGIDRANWRSREGTGDLLVRWLPAMIIILGVVALPLGLAAMRPRRPGRRGSDVAFVLLMVVMFGLVLTPCFIYAYLGWALRGWK
jgi:hypothetical protein